MGKWGSVGVWSLGGARGEKNGVKRQKSMIGRTKQGKGAVGKIELEKGIFSQPRKPLHKGSRDRKQFSYWMSIKPECDERRRQSAKRWQRQNEISTPYTQDRR